MMKKMFLAAICLALIGSMAQAAPSVTVPGGFPTIQAAINAVDDGGTVTITDSATYAGEVVFNKSAKVIAAAGQSPTIQNSGTTNTAVITFTAGSAQLGSLTGGQIKVRLIKSATTTQSPAMFCRFWHTTDSLVTLENLDMLETGTTTVNQVTGMMQDINRKANVTMRYINLDINRTVLTTGGAYGIVVGDTTAVINNTSQGGPVYTLDHVRIKNYTRGAIWNHFKDAEFNISYCETGTLGERQGTINYPWSGFLNNNAPARMVGRFDHTIMRGSAAYDACLLQTNGSTVSLSRCVFISGFNINNTGVAGALRLGGVTGVAWPGKLNITADHCDFVDLGSAGSGAGAIVRAAAETLTTVSLVVTNSNIYSLNNKAVNLLTNRAGIDSFTSSNNNVFGPGVSAGYTAGPGDISFDPGYINASGSNMQYRNNTLKTADSAGGPIGTNGDYSDVFGQGVLPGNPGVLNRAHGWTVLK